MRLVLEGLEVSALPCAGCLSVAGFSLLLGRFTLGRRFLLGGKRGSSLRRGSFSSQTDVKNVTHGSTPGGTPVVHPEVHQWYSRRYTYGSIPAYTPREVYRYIHPGRYTGYTHHHGIPAIPTHHGIPPTIHPGYTLHIPLSAPVPSTAPLLRRCRERGPWALSGDIPWVRGLCASLISYSREGW